MSTTLEKEYNDAEIASITGKPKNVEIAGLKTIEAYKKAYAEKGIVPTGKNDYPRSGARVILLSIASILALR